MLPDSDYPSSPQEHPPQLPLPDIHYDTQLTLWTDVDLDALGVDKGRANRLSEMFTGDRMMVALTMAGLTPIERIVNAALAFHGWLPYPGLDHLETDLGIAKRHITTAIRALQVKTGLRKYKTDYGHGRKSFQYAFSGIAVLAALDAKEARKRDQRSRDSENGNGGFSRKQVLPKKGKKSRDSEFRSHDALRQESIMENADRDSEFRSHEALRDSEFRNLTGIEPEDIVVVTDNNNKYPGFYSGSAPETKSETPPAPAREPATPAPDWWPDFERQLAKELLPSGGPPDFVAISEKAALAAWGDNVLQETARRMVATYRGKKVSNTTAVFLKIAVSVASELARPVAVRSSGSAVGKYAADYQRRAGSGGGRRGS